MSSISFRVILPTPDLKDVVTCFRIAKYTGHEPISVNVCPNGLPGIVFQAGCVKSIATSHGIVNVPKLFLYGQVTEPSVMHFKSGPYTTVQVLLNPNALRLLSADASKLTNNFLPAADFAAEQLENQLLAAKDEQSIIKLLSDFLRSLVKRNSVNPDKIIQQSLSLINQNSSLGVADVTDMLNVSERQFQKRFKQAVCMAPQLYIRILRFNKAMQLMDSNKYDRLSDIAFALDFHDQSHFIRDIKEFSGKTPKGITQKVDEFYHDQVGTSFL
jgi:AraC-like DNA-binding protein